MNRTSLCVGIVGLFLCSCATTIGASDPTSIPQDAAASCEAQCASVGLELDAIAIGKREVGCICEQDD